MNRNRVVGIHNCSLSITKNVIFIKYEFKIESNLSRIGSCETSGPRSGTRLGTSLSRLSHSLQTSCGSLRLTSRTRIFHSLRICSFSEKKRGGSELSPHNAAILSSHFPSNNFNLNKKPAMPNKWILLPLRNRKQLFGADLIYLVL